VTELAVVAELGRLLCPLEPTSLGLRRLKDNLSSGWLSRRARVVLKPLSEWVEIVGEGGYAIVGE